MQFLHLFNKSSSAYDGFAKIQGYEDIKDIVRHVLDSNENYNLPFVGPPSSSRILFLQGILEVKSGVYFDGSNTTSRILDVLQERRPKIICIDELDKMVGRVRMMRTLLDFENAILDLFEKNRITIQDAKFVLWTMLSTKMN